MLNGNNVKFYIDMFPELKINDGPVKLKLDRDE